MQKITVHSNKKRLSEIDGLRGIAAISVVLYHLVSTFHEEYGYMPIPFFNFRFGYYGVELFFLISGFVIYYTLTQSKGVIDFLIKRFIRLYPTYWLCMTLTFIVVLSYPFNNFRDSTLREFIFGLSMLQGLVKIKSVDPSFWSLQIELMFYLFMAAIFYFRGVKQINLIMLVWLFLIALYPLYGNSIPMVGAIINARYGSLFVAGICFYKIKIEQDRTLQVMGLLFASFLVSLIALKDMDQIVIATTIIFVLFFLANFKLNSVFDSKLFLFLGKISYALYLIHQNIGFVILRILKSWGYFHPLIVIIPIAVSILLAWIITDVYEKKIGKLLKYRLIKEKNA